MCQIGFTLMRHLLYFFAAAQFHSSLIWCADDWRLRPCLKPRPEYCGAENEKFSSGLMATA